MTVKLSVDRIEENFAVCQDLLNEKMVDISLDNLPKEVKEGDILIKKEDNAFYIDHEETKKRRKKILDLQNKILNNFAES